MPVFHEKANEPTPKEQKHIKQISFFRIDGDDVGESP